MYLYLNFLPLWLHSAHCASFKIPYSVFQASTELNCCSRKDEFLSDEALVSNIYNVFYFVTGAPGK